MSTEETRSIVRRGLEAIDRADLDAFERLCTPDYRLHFPGAPDALPLEGAKHLFGSFFSAFPGIRHDIEDLIAEGDMAACRLTVHGVHRGDLQGISPTGRQVSFVSHNIWRLKDGKIAEQWSSFDTLGMMQQLGVIPSPGQPQTA